jgi:very-short-patch-repair endonuclease
LHTLDVIDSVARPQLGLVSRTQLLAAGIGRAQVEGMLTDGVLLRAHAGVYRTAGTPASYRRDLLAATLASNSPAVASHRGALALWDLLDGLQPVEITVRRTKRVRLRSAVVHRSSDLLDAHCTVRRCVPITKPARTLVDAGAVLPPALVAQCVERALTRKLVTVAGLQSVLDEVGRCGRNGTGVLRTYLDHRPLGGERPESVLEPLMARLWRDHGVGPIEYQATLELEGHTLRPDFLIRLARVVVEIDGLEVHSTREALDHDLERQNLLTRHGFLVLRYTRTHLRRPARVAREILEVARSRLPATASGAPLAGGEGTILTPGRRSA